MAQTNHARDAEAESGGGEVLTWAVMLGRWVDFAKSAVALPDDAAGRRMRDSIADIIMVQAVWFALEHLDDLEADERALGLDRAQVLLDKHIGRLERRWTNERMPETLAELVEDARGQLARKTQET